jgi:hypothetical protein
VQPSPQPPPKEQLPEGVFDSLARELPADRPAVIFRDVARRSGIFFVHSRGGRTSMLPEDMGSGVAWGDYDNDGDADLYLVNQPGPLPVVSPSAAAAPTDKLYRNNGDGSFTDVTRAAGVETPGFGMGAFWGDYDNDGCLDLYVTNYGKSRLYRNNCDGTFDDVTEPAWATIAGGRARCGSTTTRTGGSTFTSATTWTLIPRPCPLSAVHCSTASMFPSR